MSALAKPMISPTATALPGWSAVPAEHLKSIDPLTTPPYTTGGTGEHMIIFSLLGVDNQTKEVRWYYADDTDRDADLVLVRNTISAVVS